MIRKQNILRQLVDEENDEIMKEINDNFGIIREDNEQNGRNNKRVGRIVKQLHDRYETYGREDDSDDAG